MEADGLKRRSIEFVGQREFLYENGAEKNGAKSV